MIAKAKLTAYYYIYITIDLCASLICFSSSLCLFKCQQIANSTSKIYDSFSSKNYNLLQCPIEQPFDTYFTSLSVLQHNIILQSGA